MSSKKASTLFPSPDLVRAAAFDAGEQSMRKNGRTYWDRNDYNAAAAMHASLVRSFYTVSGDEEDDCFLRFQMLEAAQRQGWVQPDVNNNDFREHCRSKVRAGPCDVRGRR